MKQNLKHLKKSLVLQHDQSDCGVACLLSIIQYYEGVNSLEKLRELSGTTKQGTTLLGLYQAAGSLDLVAEGCEADLNSLIEHDKPVILHVLIRNRLKHYVVCYGYQDEEFIIGDPAHGIQRYSKEDLEEIWKSKTCLTLEPTINFSNAKTVKASKKEWFLRLLREDFDILKISLALGLVIAILGMAMAIFSQKLIDDILPSRDYGKLVTGIVLVAFLLLVRTAFSSLREYFLTRQSKDFNNRIIDRFFGSLLRLPKSFFDTRKVGDLVARLNDTRRVQKVIRTIAGGILIDALVVLVSFGFLFYYSWQTGLISLVSLPFYFFLLYRANKEIINAQRETMQGYAHSEGNFISTIQGIATIKNNSRQSFFQEQNRKVYGNFQEKLYRLGLINVRLSLISGIFSIAFLIAVLSFNSMKVYNEQLLLGELMAILGIAGSLLPSVANLALVTIPINEAKVAFNRMFEFAGMQKEYTGKTQVDNFKSLVIKNLSFRFAGRKQLLKNLSLKIEKGQSIAIVGESGCGKSTLGQILQKFYNFEGGKAVVNDYFDLEDLELESWRNLVGVIPQEIQIFPGTIINNILLGKENEMDDILDFCKSYGFDKFIQQFPQGYKTLLGEEGINLSGGQKQIIALARALYKKPQLLILDEATSAMDRNTEKFTMDLLRKLRDELAIIFISHRLHTIRSLADRIYVLENGSFLNEGTHDELLQTENFYSDYWTELLEHS
mgnify:CR=1 FL=1